MPKKPTIPPFRAEFYASLTVAELLERTAELTDGRDGSAVEAHLYAIEAEQARRLLPSADAHVRAGRENIARSMTTDDLQSMLPDFKQVAALCGIRPEQVEVNRQIVIAELRRRGVDVAKPARLPDYPAETTIFPGFP